MNLPLEIANSLQFYLASDQEVDKLVIMEPNLDRYYHDQVTDTDGKDPKKVLNLRLIKHVDFKMYTNLKVLNCSHSRLKRLDNLPATLKELYCSYNQITSLDNLPRGLKTLYCGSNQITSLDNLPQGLKKLDCNHNQITSLNKLPKSLGKLIK